MKVVIRQKRMLFGTVAWVLADIRHNTTIREVAQELIEQNEGLTIELREDAEGEASAEILKNGEVVGTIDVAN